MKTKRTVIHIHLLGVLLVSAFTGGAQTVTKIAAGSGHSLFIKSDGSLWAFGYNGNGQLGDGTYGGASGYTNLPEMIVPSNVTAIAAGYQHSLFLKGDGSLWGMGQNGHGELGFTNTFSGTNRPVLIVPNGVTAISAGYYFSLFLMNDGSLFGMGNDITGQLGDARSNILEFAIEPAQGVSGATAISAGGGQSLFLTNGVLWGMGQNNFGELGDGTYNNISEPERTGPTNVTAIAAGNGGDSHFIKNDGSLWSMGYNNYGQLGDGGACFFTNQPEQIEASNVTAVASGYYNCMFIKSDGSLWAMGTDYNGQLGDGNNSAETNTPEQIVPGNVTAVAMGWYHTLFIKSDGSLWAMGANANGQLGYGAGPSTNRPVLVVPGSGFPPGYDRISARRLGGGDVQLSFVGIAGSQYALDRSVRLVPANWVPQLTNAAGAGGVLVFTNTPDPATNNFWRIRSVP